MGSSEQGTVKGREAPFCSVLSGLGGTPARPGAAIPHRQRDAQASGGAISGSVGNELSFLLDLEPADGFPQRF